MTILQPALRLYRADLARGRHEVGMIVRNPRAGERIRTADLPLTRRLCRSTRVHRGRLNRRNVLLVARGVHVRRHVSTAVVSTAIAREACPSGLTFRFCGGESVSRHTTRTTIPNLGGRLSLRWRSPIAVACPENRRFTDDRAPGFEVLRDLGRSTSALTTAQVPSHACPTRTDSLRQASRLRAAWQVCRCPR